MAESTSASASRAESPPPGRPKADGAPSGAGAQRLGGTDYAQRLRRVTEYIHDHLDEDLDLDRLADLACMSAFHWHRVYLALHGETIAATVRRLRLHRAAGDIAHTRMPMREVARRSGYGSLQSFTRAFKAVYGMPPAAYRERGSHAVFEQAASAPQPQPQPELTVEIQERPALLAIAVAHQGSYMGIGRAFELLYGRLSAQGVLARPFRSIGIYLDDPDAQDQASLRSHACVVPASPHPQAVHRIHGGRHAVLRYRGPYASMRGAYRWLYGEWLLHSGHEAADAPVIEEYLNDPRTTAPGDLLTDIALPLRS